MEANEYDLVVIGSGPAGQKGAICAAKMRKKVAIIDRKKSVGGVCVHTGTIPSKTLREAVLYLSGFRQRTFYGRGYVLKDRIAMSDLIFRAQAVMAREVEVIKAQLRRNYVTILEGDARFLDANTLEVKSDEGSQLVRGNHVLIACGTRPAHSVDIPMDGHRIFDSDQVHCLEEIPRDLIVVGAGIIGLEYASMFAALGVKITLLDQRPILLDFVDREIVESLCFQLRQLGTVFRLSEKVVSVGFDEERNRVFAKLASGKNVHGQGLLYTIGRQANGDLLNLESAGLNSGGPGQAFRERTFSDYCPSYLCRGRRDRISRSGQHIDGAGPPRQLSHVWQAGKNASQPYSLWHLHHPGDFHGRANRRTVDEGEHQLRSGTGSLCGTGQRPDAGR